MPYHHGDLLAALTATAVELAREGGPDAVVLREVVRRVGVSPGAAYRHVADRAALLDLVARQASEMLVTRMRSAHDAVAATDPAGRALLRFRTSGVAYVQFALAEPGLFRTGFASTQDLMAGGPAQVLAEDLDDLLAVGLLDPAGRRRAEAVAWASVHGLAVLLLDERLPAPDRAEAETDDPDGLLARLLDTVAFGLLPRR